MRYPPDLLDEIRSRVPVSRVVERHVKLRRAGREYVGLSPFKTEKTPSFTVNDHKGFYHCFASGEHGDIFNFLMTVEGLAFPEAVERLAAEARAILPAPKPVDEVKASHRRASGKRWKRRATFLKLALAGREGSAARAYLEKRGVQFSGNQAFQARLCARQQGGFEAASWRQGLFARRDAGCGPSDPRRRHRDPV